MASKRKAIRDLSTQCDGPQGCASTGSATSGGARPADHGLGSHSQANTRRQNATTRRHGLAEQVRDLAAVCVDPTPHRESLGLPPPLVCDAPWPDLHASGCVCCPTIATIMAFLNRITVLQVLLFAVGIFVVGTIPAQGKNLNRMHPQKARISTQQLTRSAVPLLISVRSVCSCVHNIFQWLLRRFMERVSM